jgi:hypothetical protein
LCLVVKKFRRLKVIKTLDQSNSEQSIWAWVKHRFAVDPPSQIPLFDTNEPIQSVCWEKVQFPKSSQVSVDATKDVGIF